MSATVSDLEPRVAVLEEIARSTKATLERIDRRLDSIENRVIALQSNMDSRFIAIQSDQRSDFRWLLGVGLGAFGAIFGLLAHAQHWL
jgi:hypothetical protein